MRYGFIRLRNNDGSLVYMEARHFDRYSNDEFIITSRGKSHAESLVIYDNIYIGLFPLLFKEDDILKYNTNASISVEIPLSDIDFRSSKPSSVSRALGCFN